jgi:CBS domain containing-hemolysin-like protein
MSDPERTAGAEPDPNSSPASAPARGPTIWNRLRALLALRSPSLRDDLEVALEEDGSAETADFSQSERTILKNVLKLGELRVDDVMVPRADIEGVE